MNPSSHPTAVSNKLTKFIIEYSTIHGYSSRRNSLIPSHFPNVNNNVLNDSSFDKNGFPQTNNFIDTTNETLFDHSKPIDLLNESYLMKINNDNDLVLWDFLLVR